MDTIQYQLEIRGKVQGVFYRVSALEKAKELKLTGWTRNEPDGSVSIVAEGPADALNHYLGWCLRGPARAEVESVLVKKGKAEGFSRFEMR